MKARFVIEAVLAEGRLQNAIDRYKAVPSEAVHKLAALDPSDNLKYLDWMTATFDKAYNSPEREDDPSFLGRLAERIADAVKRFHTNVTGVDISSIDRSLESLSAVVAEKTAPEGKKKRIMKNTDVVYSDEESGVEAVFPQNHEACQYHGGGTSWCISTSSKGHYEDYFSESPIFIVSLPFVAKIPQDEDGNAMIPTDRDSHDTEIIDGKKYLSIDPDDYAKVAVRQGHGEFYDVRDHSRPMKLLQRIFDAAGYGQQYEEMISSFEDFMDSSYYAWQDEFQQEQLEGFYKNDGGTKRAMSLMASMFDMNKEQIADALKGREEDLDRMMMRFIDGISSNHGFEDAKHWEDFADSWEHIERYVEDSELTDEIHDLIFDYWEAAGPTARPYNIVKDALGMKMDDLERYYRGSFRNELDDALEAYAEQRRSDWARVTQHSISQRLSSLEDVINVFRETQRHDVADNIERIMKESSLAQRLVNSLLEDAPDTDEVSIVVVMRPSSEGQQVLLVKNDQDFWGIAGGHLEEDEEPAQAAQRELMEETGITVGDPKLLYQLGSVHHEDRDCTAHVFVLNVPEGTEAQANDDALEAQWFTAAQLAEMEQEAMQDIRIAAEVLLSADQTDALGQEEEE